MKRTSALLLTALLGIVTACGSSDADDDARSTTSTTPRIESLDPDAIDTEASPYCATWAELRSAPSTVGADQEAMKRHYAALQPVVARLRDEAPEEIRAAVELAVSSTAEAAATGRAEVFTRPDVVRAQQALAGYARDHCAKP